MDEHTLGALTASIRHWEENVSRAKNKFFIHIGASSCALCFNFNSWLSRANHVVPCKGCPVSERTGQQYCKGTPYERVRRVWQDFSPHWTEVEKVCQEEVDFLRSLLPEGVQV